MKKLTDVKLARDLSVSSFPSISDKTLRAEEAGTKAAGIELEDSAKGSKKADPPPVEQTEI